MGKAIAVSNSGVATVGSKPAPGEYRPATDAEAKELIESIDHYVWETFKVKGQFTHSPYAIGAETADGKYIIYLPGRKGTVLSWLLTKLEERGL